MTGAVGACQRAVELAPRVPEAHYHLAETLPQAREPSAHDGMAGDAPRGRPVTMRGMERLADLQRRLAPIFELKPVYPAELSCVAGDEDQSPCQRSAGNQDVIPTNPSSGTGQNGPDVAG